VFAALLLTGLASGFGLRAQTLTVTPVRLLIDQTADVRAAGLPAGEHLILKASLIDGAGQHWESQAEFAADSQGGIDLSTQAPVRGSYKGVWATFLLSRPQREASRQSLQYLDNRYARGAAVHRVSLSDHLSSVVMRK
jgi:hypothetical protein